MHPRSPLADNLNHRTLTLPRPLKLVALGLAPVLYVAAGLVLKASRGPYWLGTNADPEYAYLFNALSIAGGHAPYHVDHPGTPLQMLGAVVLRAIALASGCDALVPDVIARPETYLTALLVQASPRLFLATSVELSRVRPEPLLIALSSVYGAVLLTSTAETARRD